MKLKLISDKILITGILLLLLSITGVIVVSISKSRQVHNTANMVVYTQEVLIHSEKLLSLVLGNESGMRGYIITGKSTFLPPLENSRKEIYTELDHLKVLTADNPSQQARIDSLYFYIAKRLRFSNQVIAVYDLHGAKAAMAIVETGEGKSYSDHIQQVIDAIQVLENGLLVQRKNVNKKVVASFDSILIVLIAGLLLLSGVFIQKLRVDFFTKRRAEAALLKLNDELEQRVEDRTEELNKSQTNLRTIWRTEPECIKLLNLNNEVEDMNPAGLVIIEADSLEQIKGKSILPIINEDYRELFKDLTSNVFKGADEILQFEITGLKGTRRWLETHAVPLKNTEGEIVSLLGVTRDITESKIAAQSILKERDLSDSIINNLPGIFYLYNRDGKFLRWNTNFEKVTLYSTEEISKMRRLDFLDDFEKESFSQMINNIFTSGEDSTQADLLLKTKEKIPYFFTGSAIEYEGESCVMGIGIDFSERVKAQEMVKQSSEQLRELAAHLLGIREEERKRIGREIHDELGQQLTAIKMDVSWIDKKMPEENDAIRTKLKNVITLLDGGNQSIRRILNELRPVILADYGLLEALQWQGQQFTVNTGTALEFTSTETQMKVAEEIATCIFRVYQEALTNITRYADAHKVLISLKVINDTIMLTITDDGKGFDITVAKQKKSFGILGMRERVNSVNGNFDLVTAPGKGTKISVGIPLKQQPIKPV